MVQNGIPTLKMSKSSSAPMVYAGEFRHAIDAKHRVTIPSRWRGEDGEEFFAVQDPAGSFLMILPPPEFERVK